MIYGKSGIGYSFESGELIQELEQDLREFGEDETFAVWLRRCPQCENVEFVVNYDFLTEENPIGKDELIENERLVIMEGKVLLGLLKKQDSLDP